MIARLCAACSLASFPAAAGGRLLPARETNGRGDGGGGAVELVGRGDGGGAAVELVRGDSRGGSATSNSCSKRELRRRTLPAGLCGGVDGAAARVELIAARCRAACCRGSCCGLLGLRRLLVGDWGIVTGRMACSPSSWS